MLLVYACTLYINVIVVIPTRQVYAEKEFREKWPEAQHLHLRHTIITLFMLTQIHTQSRTRNRIYRKHTKCIMQASDCKNCISEYECFVLDSYFYSPLCRSASRVSRYFGPFFISNVFNTLDVVSFRDRFFIGSTHGHFSAMCGTVGQGHVIYGHKRVNC